MWTHGHTDGHTHIKNIVWILERFLNIGDISVQDKIWSNGIPHDRAPRQVEHFQQMPKRVPDRAQQDCKICWFLWSIVRQCAELCNLLGAAQFSASHQWTGRAPLPQILLIHTGAKWRYVQLYIVTMSTLYNDEVNCKSQQSSSPLSICWLALFSLSGWLFVCLHGNISIYLH